MLYHPGEEDRKPGEKDMKHGEFSRPGDRMPAGSGEDGPEKHPAGNGDIVGTL
jgi:hypothetical protein